MANLIALTAARDHALGEKARTHGLQARGAPLVLYTSDEIHSSIDKAVSILGLGNQYLRHIPTDEHFRIRLDLLADAITADRAAGRIPFCVAASTNSGSTSMVPTAPCPL